MKVALIIGSAWGETYKKSSSLLESVSSAFGEKIELAIYQQPCLNSDLMEHDKWLFLTSTTGRGELPVALQRFSKELTHEHPKLSNVQYLICGIGDAGYGEHYCAAARRVHELMQCLGATRVAHNVYIDVSKDEVFQVEKWKLSWLKELEKWLENKGV